MATTTTATTAATTTTTAATTTTTPLRRVCDTASRTSLLDDVDTVLFDCDGVLWRGTTVFECTRRVIDALRAGGRRCVFLTNNSTKSRQAAVDRFAAFGVTVALDDVMTSAHAAAYELASSHFVGAAYVVGERGIVDELRAVGIDARGGDDDRTPLSIDEIGALPVDDDVRAVVVGLDRNLNYRKLAVAQHYLMMRRDAAAAAATDATTTDAADSHYKCAFIATNCDSTFPAGPPGRVMPGAGTMVAALEAAAGRRARVLGKPTPALLSLVRKKYAPLDARRTLMVGDRLNTDIAFGHAGGFRTLLVLSGVDSLASARASEWQPTHYARSIAQMIDDDGDDDDDAATMH